MTIYILTFRNTRRGKLLETEIRDLNVMLRTENQVCEIKDLGAAKLPSPFHELASAERRYVGRQAA